MRVISVGQLSPAALPNLQPIGFMRLPDSGEPQKITRIALRFEMNLGTQPAGKIYLRARMLRRTARLGKGIKTQKAKMLTAGISTDKISIGGIITP